MGLPRAAVADRNHVLSASDVLAAGKLQHQCLVERRDRRKLETVQALDRREPRLLDAALDHPLFPVDQFERDRNHDEGESRNEGISDWIGSEQPKGLQVIKVRRKRPYAFWLCGISIDDPRSRGFNSRPIGAILIALPDAEDRREINLTLELDIQASEFLWKQVSRLIDDISRHIEMQTEIAQGRNRAEQLKYIRTMSRYLTKLEKHSTDRDVNTDRILRSHLGPRLGELLSHRGFERLIESSPTTASTAAFLPPE